MEVTVGEIITATIAIDKIINKDFPAKTSFRLKRLSEKLAPTKATFDKTRNDLVVTKYGVKSEEEDTYTVPKEQFNDYADAINDLCSVKENIDVVPFSIDDFGTVELPLSFFNDMTVFIVD